MSLSAHRKSTYRLRRLPRCSKCKVEFLLVYSHYELEKELRKEWECPKCHKIVPMEMLKEESPSDQDIALHKWCQTNQRRRNR